MRLHILAVGHADAIVLELPSGRLAVVDFGHHLLLDYLAALDPTDSRRFAFALLTHAHHDHYACLEQFIQRFDARVEEYWFSFASPGSLPPLLSLWAAALRHGRGRLLIQDLPAPQPYSIEPDMEIFRFAPTTAEALRPPGSGNAAEENNRGVVLLVRYGRAAVLLGADAEESRWRRIGWQATAGKLTLTADVIKPPHHGAVGSLPTDLWPALFRSPETIVAFSVGRRRGMPAAGTIVAVREQARIRCTGRALTCRPLSTPDAAPAPAPPRSLLQRALRPAPESQPVQACFGTQVYEIALDGRVSVLRSEQPAFLDACLVPTESYV